MVIQNIKFHFGVGRTFNTLNKNKIEDVTITQFISATDNINIITAKNADISSKNWLLNKVKVVDKLSISNKYEF